MHEKINPSAYTLQIPYTKLLLLASNKTASNDSLQVKDPV